MAAYLKRTGVLSARRTTGVTANNRGYRFNVYSLVRR
jgi:hypothetical protein